MRICSLVPGATEIVVALGLADQLVGVSHECDFPPSVTNIPVMIEPLVGHDTGCSAAIDQQVKAMAASGQPLYRLKISAFTAAQPDLVLTQDLCHVCAITPDQLSHAMQLPGRRPDVVTLSPASLQDILRDIERIAGAVNRRKQGTALRQSLHRRIDAVRMCAAGRMSRPRVLCLEWLAPLYLAGHWIPEMVELAGGLDVLGSNDAPSRETSWKEVEEARPDVVLIMPCGYTIDRTIKELSNHGAVQMEWKRAHTRWPQIYVLNAASYFSRPGPRLIDGLEVLANILNPDRKQSLDPDKAIQLVPTAFGMASQA